MPPKQKRTASALTLDDQEQVPFNDLYATTALLSEDAIKKLLLTIDGCFKSLAIQLEGCGILADTYFSSPQSHFKSVMPKVDNCVDLTSSALFRRQCESFAATMTFNTALATLCQIC